MDRGGPISTEIAFVLFADVVGYSLLPIEEQAAKAKLFKSIAREVAGQFDCPLALDSGDGIALVFFGAPLASGECAVSLGRRLAQAEIGVRIGLHCGPVTRLEDVNNRPNAVGPALNIAERVMSCGDKGHLLLSSAAADFLGAHGDWRDRLQDLGEAEVKHGVLIRVFNLAGEDFGNSDIPERIRLQPRKLRRNNFTEPDRPFVGRRVELESLAQRLEQRQERLLTITGPGGIGKTRLAIEAARAAEPNYADGAWIIECDALATKEDILAQIASIFDLQLGAEPVATLREFLSDKQVLLVFDCFERIVRLSNVLDDLLKHCAELQLIVTSRTLLGLSRESEIVLNPLSMKRESGATADAITLFLNSAKAIDPGFRLTRQNHEIVEGIVEAVEGVPLAIVLAAGRLRHLSLEELHDQLGKRRLDILRRRVSVDDRHSNLTRVVEDSFGLLRPELQRLLVFLSVFRGFHIRDAEAVFPDFPELLDGVSELRENSLLAAQVVDEQMRYRSLDVIAEYIERITDQAHLAPLRVRHAEHFARRAGSLRELYEDGRWKEANAGLSAEIGNYRRAIDVAVETKDFRLVQPLARALARILMEAGYRADFEKLAAASLQVSAEESDVNLLSEISGLMGALMKRDKQYGEAERLWLRKAYYANEAGDADGEGDTWLDLATMAVEANDIAKAEGFLQRFDELIPRLSDPVIQASGQATKALVAVQLGHDRQAEDYARLAARLIEALPLTLHTLGIWTVLAETYNELKRPDLSERLCTQGLRVALQTKGLTFAAHLLLKLADSLDQQDRAEAADVVSICEMVPKSLSPTLRERTRAFREAFIKKRGEEMLKTCEKTRRGLDWQVEALDLIESLEGNAQRAAP